MPKNEKNSFCLKPEIEIFDYEKASAIIKKAKTVSVGNCACRSYHKAAGEDIGNAPLRTCFSFNNIADNLVRNGTAEYCTKEEGLKILENCKKLGYVQNGDNSKNCSYMFAKENSFFISFFFKLFNQFIIMQIGAIATRNSVISSIPLKF